MGLTIRRACEGDAGQTAALINHYVAEGRFTAMTELVTAESQADFIRELPESTLYQVAVDDAGQVLGLQIVFPFSVATSMSHVGDIGTFVSPAAHQRGVGRALAESTFEESRRLGYRKIIAMIRGDNERAQSFYKSIGFQFIGVSKEHACVRGQYIDEHFYEKMLL